jgi:hypothetical protein
VTENNDNYEQGPLVLTFVGPEAALDVYAGVPVHGSNPYYSISGDDFTGQFFVPAGHCIKGTSQTCMCSWFTPTA